MLATVAFLAFWVVVGLVLFFIALRGGPRGARATLQSQSRGGRRTAIVVFAVFYVAIGVAVPVLILVGNHDSADARVDGTTIELTQQEQDGRAIFGEYCASCHTLAAARRRRQGRPEPRPAHSRPRALVEDAVERGRQRGNGTMPAGIVQGEDVAAVVGVRRRRRRQVAACATPPKADPPRIPGSSFRGARIRPPLSITSAKRRCTARFRC